MFFKIDGLGYVISLATGAACQDYLAGSPPHTGAAPSARRLDKPTRLDVPTLVPCLATIAWLGGRADGSDVGGSKTIVSRRHRFCFSTTPTARLSGSACIAPSDAHTVSIQTLC